MLISLNFANYKKYQLLSV